jgi:hypothetical protein
MCLLETLKVKILAAMWMFGVLKSVEFCLYRPTVERTKRH